MPLKIVLELAILYKPIFRGGQAFELGLEMSSIFRGGSQVEQTLKLEAIDNLACIGVAQ